MIRHRTLSTQPHTVISNGCDDKFLSDVIVVLRMWMSFVLGQFLGLDNVYLLIFFLDRFASPLGTDITFMSAEQSVLMMT